MDPPMLGGDPRMMPADANIDEGENYTGYSEARGRTEHIPVSPTYSGTIFQLPPPGHHASGLTSSTMPFGSSRPKRAPREPSRTAEFRPVRLPSRMPDVPPVAFEPALLFDPFRPPPGRPSRMSGMPLYPLDPASSMTHMPQDPFAPRPSAPSRSRSTSGLRNIEQEFSDLYPFAQVPGRLSAAAPQRDVPANRPQTTPQRSRRQSVSGVDRRPSMSGRLRRSSVPGTPTPSRHSTVHGTRPSSRHSSFHGTHTSSRRSRNPYDMSHLTNSMNGMRVGRPTSPGVDRFHTLHITTSSGLTLDYSGSSHTRGFERMPQHCHRHEDDVFHW